MRIPPLKRNVRGYGRVRYKGKDYYFGKYGTPECDAAYQAWVRKLFDQPPPAVGNGQAFQVAHLLLHYLAWAKTYYVDPDTGEPNKEFNQLRYASKYLNARHGDTPVDQFGPNALKEVREAMVAALDKHGQRRMTRSHINHQVQRIRRIFRWGVENELVPPSTLHGLQAVTALKRGRTEAREAVKKKPATDGQVMPILPYVSPTVAAMIQVQRWTGMRPENVCLMRQCDMVMDGDAWEYRPPRHKNSWRGGELLVLLGPKCQAVLAPLLASKRPDEYIFSPKDSVAWHSARRRAARKSKMTPSQRKRRKKLRPKEPPKDHYETGGYRQAVHYGVDQHNATCDREERPNDKIEYWTPAQLRKSRATELRRLFGIEAAQVSLGHTKADVTQVYAERDFKLALRIALETG